MDELTGSRNARDAEDTIPYPVPAAPPIAGDGLGAGGATGSGGDRARAESNDDEITDPPKVGDLDPNGLKIDKIFKSNSSVCYLRGRRLGPLHIAEEFQYRANTSANNCGSRWVTGKH